MEKREQLRCFLREPGVHFCRVRLVKKFSDWVDNRTDLHDIDAVFRSWANADIAAIDVGAGPPKFMGLIRRYDKSLDPLHPHPQRHEQLRVSFPRTGSPNYGDIGIFIFTCIEDIHIDKGQISTIHTHYNTVVVAYLRRCKHICAGCTAGHNISSCQIEQFFLIRQGGRHYLKRVFQTPFDLLHFNIIGVKIVIDPL